MRILIANDDGIYSPGICLLAEAAAKFGEVRIVAPAVEQSSMAHAVTASRPLTHRRTRIAHFDAFRVDGTPADCVGLGMFVWGHVDVVFSGINLGLNVGNAMWHSGTLAAAKQASLLGARGIAFSAPDFGDDDSLRALRPHVEDVIARLIQRPDLELVNVNFPARPRGVRYTKQSVRHYAGQIEKAHDPQGRDIFWFVPRPVERPDPDTDRCAIEDDFISITPLRLDLTDHRELESLRANAK